MNKLFCGLLVSLFIGVGAHAQTVLQETKKKTPKPSDKEALVPMRDGARLALDLYFPGGPSNGLPVALERTPYNKAIFGPVAKFWTARGYVYAIQDVRGRFRSEGRFEPFLREGPDGFDTIEWLASQPSLQSFRPPFEKAFDDLPVAGQDLKVFGRADEIWRKWCSETPDSDYWKSARYLSKVDRITVPVLHQSGWFDDDGLGTKLNYLAMRYFLGSDFALLPNPETSNKLL